MELHKGGGKKKNSIAWYWSTFVYLIWVQGLGGLGQV